MRTLIVDDEPLARSRLKRLLQAHRHFTLIGEATNGEEALTLTAKLKPDLILLDIEMPGENGLEVAAKINQLPIPPAIIFVTAHAEHALDAYRVKPEDYLLKPVDAARLAQALKQLGTQTRAHLEKKEEENPWITYQIGTSLRRIRFDQVQYFIAEDKLVRMVFDGGEAILDKSLKQLEKELQGKVLRVHRNTLINRCRLERLTLLPNGQHLVSILGCTKKIEASRRLASIIKHTLFT
ncbi:LytR/AlgR family response regulator transcription factor [Nitrincola tapanii]|uniref:Response regulator transcription factor n=1 Tax=Nitrincola tapanii TaxID=1708751 RepID=A0A5A9W838_9GAMM|nr:LytTR family DNA-binding domain-containing protein [Nitrincola tapanii]KAA0876278.1 response regulator transcription factor [Nitrincola tapanii]